VKRLKNFTLILILISLCRITSAEVGLEPSTISLINTTTENKIRQSTMYLKANFFHKNRDYPRAFKAYNYLNANESSPYINDGYLRLLYDTNQFLAIVSLLDSRDDLKQLFSSDTELNIIHALSLLNTNRHKKAEELLSNLHKKNPANTEISYYLATNHAITNKLKKALETLDNAINSPNSNGRKLFLLHFLKAKILLKMKQKHRALASINNCLSRAPRFAQAKLFKALLLEQLQNFELAIECYKTYLSLVRNAWAILKQVVHLLVKTNRYAEAADEFEKLPNKTPEQKFDLALIKWKANRHANALTNIDDAISEISPISKTLLTRARILKIEILFSYPTDKTPQIKSLFHAWLTNNPENNSPIFTLFSLCKRGLPLATAIEILEKVEHQLGVIDENRQDLKKFYGLSLALADLYLLNNRKASALAKYQQLLPQTENKAFKEELTQQVHKIETEI